MLWSCHVTPTPHTHAHRRTGARGGMRPTGWHWLRPQPHLQLLTGPARHVSVLVMLPVGSSTKQLFDSWVSGGRGWPVGWCKPSTHSLSWASVYTAVGCCTRLFGIRVRHLLVLGWECDYIHPAQHGTQLHKLHALLDSVVHSSDYPPTASRPLPATGSHLWVTLYFVRVQPPQLSGRSLRRVLGC